MSESLFFIIDGGKALELVKRHIAAQFDCVGRARALAIELDAADVSTPLADGKVVAVPFKGAPHPDFKRPGKWGSQPRKGTEWEKQLRGRGPQAGFAMSGLRMVWVRVPWRSKARIRQSVRA